MPGKWFDEVTLDSTWLAFKVLLAVSVFDGSALILPTKIRTIQPIFRHLGNIGTYILADLRPHLFIVINYHFFLNL